MKKEINVFDYAGDIAKAMNAGILLTTKMDGKVNTMTIGWGMLGIEWKKPMFIALVRESRFTKEYLDQTGEFTVNVPYGEFDKKIVGYCGTKSGRDTDKIADMGLTPEEPLSISAPGLRELPLTLECRVLYHQKQDPAALPEGIREEFYPQTAESEDLYANRDYHIAYYAEIVNAYIIEE